MRRSAAKRISAIDLFCGAGGLTLGLRRAGIRVLAGIDADPACRFPYESNSRCRFLLRDVKEVEASELAGLFAGSSIRLLAGCAPCQPFSTYSRRAYGAGRPGKWELVVKLGELISELEPELVTMENVPQLREHPAFSRFAEGLAGYHVWHDIVECVSHGVPQLRKRLVLLASKLGPIRLVGERADAFCTVRHAIGDLPPIAAGESDASDPLHTAASLSQLNLRRIRCSRPGGSWRDWPSELVAACHRRFEGRNYPSVYGRMEWDSAAPTITTQCFGFGNGRFGHPEQDRAISLREAAMLQTFPLDYRFVPPGQRPSFAAVGKLIGNAVPVKLGESIGRSLVAHVGQVSGRSAEI